MLGFLRHIVKYPGGGAYRANSKKGVKGCFPCCWALNNEDTFYIRNWIK